MHDKPPAATRALSSISSARRMLRSLFWRESKTIKIYSNLWLCMYVCMYYASEPYMGAADIVYVYVVVYVNMGICMHECMYLLLRMLHVENNALIHGLCVDLP